MAFIQQGTTVFSFADFDDVLAKDSRLFDANEGLTQEVVEDSLVRSTQRIRDLISGSSWWKQYYIRLNGLDDSVVIGQAVLVPDLDPAYIRARRQDFTDLAVYHTLSEYLLPSTADFGNPDSAERQKIGFYDTKFRELYRELINDGDWYDFNGDGNITPSEKYPVRRNLVRAR